MAAPFDPIPEPMLAKPVAAVPGRRRGCRSNRSGTGSARSSRCRRTATSRSAAAASKPLTRYFPELVAEFARAAAAGHRRRRRDHRAHAATPGGERLDWEPLSQRIHPADSRVQKLVGRDPGVVRRLRPARARRRVAARRAVLRTPRRARDACSRSVTAPLHLSQTTQDAAVARRWLVEFEGAGLDGVIAKPLDAPYEPGKRTMLKIKHSRTADVVLHRVPGAQVRAGRRVAAARALHDEDGSWCRSAARRRSRTRSGSS